MTIIDDRYVYQQSFIDSSRQDYHQSLFCRFCGIFASIDIITGAIITNGFDELGHEYKYHPD